MSRPPTEIVRDECPACGHIVAWDSLEVYDEACAEHGRLQESERVRRQLADTLRPFAEAHRQRTAKGMKVGPGPALGPRQLAEASAALAASAALDQGQPDE